MATDQTILTNWEITVESPDEPISGILPATAYPIGTPMFLASVDADTGERTFSIGHADAGTDSQTTPFQGFLTRASQTVATGIGSSANNLLFGIAETGGALDTPFEVSKMGSVKKADTIIVEGTDYLDVGTSNYALSTSTAVGEELTFYANKWAVAYTAGEMVYGLVLAQLDPITAGNVRLMIKVVSPYKYVTAN